MIPSGVIISDSGVITVLVNGKLFTFASDHANYKLVKDALGKNDLSAIEKLADIPKTVQEYTGTVVTIKDGQVFYNSKPLNNGLTKRILNLMNEGFPFAPMLKFLENLMENPSCHAVNELYNFLVNRNLPITEDGCFLAYKAVQSDYKDWHTSTVDNSIGTKVEPLPRNQVDDDWRNACSNGYHVGAITYIEGFHRHDGHIMIVKVNPKDVISVPLNECTKCRVCFYEVVGEMQEEELVHALYATTPTSHTPVLPANSMSSPDEGGWPSNYDDENEDDLDDEEEEEDWEDEEEDDEEEEEDQWNNDRFGPSEPN